MQNIPANPATTKQKTNANPENNDPKQSQRCSGSQPGSDATQSLSLRCSGSHVPVWHSSSNHGEIQCLCKGSGKQSKVQAVLALASIPGLPLIDILIFLFETTIGRNGLAQTKFDIDAVQPAKQQCLLQPPLMRDVSSLMHSSPTLPRFLATFPLSVCMLC